MNKITTFVVVFASLLVFAGGAIAQETSQEAAPQNQAAPEHFYPKGNLGQPGLDFPVTGANIVLGDWYNGKDGVIVEYGADGELITARLDIYGNATYIESKGLSDSMIGKAIESRNHQNPHYALLKQEGCEVGMLGGIRTINADEVDAYIGFLNNVTKEVRSRPGGMGVYDLAFVNSMAAEARGLRDKQTDGSVYTCIDGDAVVAAASSELQEKAAALRKIPSDSADQQ